MKVRWLPRALSSLQTVVAHISEDNPIAAAKLASEVYELVDRLEFMPLLGRNGRIPGSRELVVPGGRYILVYQVVETEVHVLAVRHTSRKWPKRL